MVSKTDKSSSRAWNLGIIFAYFLIYVVWGSSYYFIELSMNGLLSETGEPAVFLLGAMRFTAAGLILIVFCIFRGEPVFRLSLIRKSAVSGTILIFIDMAVVMFAEIYLESSSVVAIVAASTAIWIMALDAPMWKKNFRNPATVIGIIIGFLGVMLLYVEQVAVESMNENGKIGILILVFGCISWSLGTLYAKYRSSGAEEVNAFAGSAWQMLIASAIFWICSIVSGDVHTDVVHVEMSTWLSLIYLIVFGSILAHSAYVWLLKVRPATEVGTHAYVNPFIAVFFGNIFGQDNTTFMQIAGLIIILLSVMMVNRKSATQ